MTTTIKAITDLTPGDIFYVGTDVMEVFGLAPPPADTRRRCHALRPSEEIGMPVGLLAVWCHDEALSTGVLLYPYDAQVTLATPAPTPPTLVISGELRDLLHDMAAHQRTRAVALGRVWRHLRTTGSLDGWEDVEREADAIREVHTTRRALRAEAAMRRARCAPRAMCPRGEL